MVCKMLTSKHIKKFKKPPDFLSFLINTWDTVKTCCSVTKDFFQNTRLNERNLEEERILEEKLNLMSKAAIKKHKKERIYNDLPFLKSSHVGLNENNYSEKLKTKHLWHRPKESFLHNKQFSNSERKIIDDFADNLSFKKINNTELSDKYKFIMTKLKEKNPHDKLFKHYEDYSFEDILKNYSKVNSNINTILSKNSNFSLSLSKDEKNFLIKMQNVLEDFEKFKISATPIMKEDKILSNTNTNANPSPNDLIYKQKNKKINNTIDEFKF